VLMGNMRNPLVYGRPDMVQLFAVSCNNRGIGSALCEFNQCGNWASAGFTENNRVVIICMMKCYGMQ